MELHFLYKLDKFLPTSKVVFERDTKYSGYYRPPECNEYQIGDKFYDCRNGIIVVNSIEEIESTLLHEWRHHWQFIKGWEYDGIGWENPPNYSQAIVNYFINSKSEMDALLFSYSKCKGELDGNWIALIQEKIPKILDEFLPSGRKWR